MTTYIAVGLTVLVAAVIIAQILTSLIRDAHRVTWEHIIGATMGSVFVALLAVFWGAHLLSGGGASFDLELPAPTSWQARP